MKKKHAFVLTGLQHQPHPDEIKEEMRNNYDITTKAVYLMKKTRTPLYLVVLDSSVKLKYLNQQVKYVDNVRIYWRRRINDKQATQCHRCQKWGHATSNCYANPKCLKCTKDHLTKDCPNNSCDNMKCANCKGDHLANSLDCDVYKKYLQRKDMHKTSKTNHLPVNKTNTSKQVQQLNEDQSSNSPNNGSMTYAQAIKSRTGEASNSKKKEDIMDIRPTNSQSTPINHAGNKFQELTTEMGKLNSLIDLNRTVELIRELNGRLQQTNSLADRFQITYNFLTNIDAQYGK